MKHFLHFFFLVHVKLRDFNEKMHNISENCANSVHRRGEPQLDRVCSEVGEGPAPCWHDPSKARGVRWERTSPAERKRSPLPVGSPAEDAAPHFSSDSHQKMSAGASRASQQPRPSPELGFLQTGLCTETKAASPFWATEVPEVIAVICMRLMNSKQFLSPIYIYIFLK